MLCMLLCMLSISEFYIDMGGLEVQSHTTLTATTLSQCCVGIGPGSALSLPGKLFLGVCNEGDVRTRRTFDGLSDFVFNPYD